ncbi:acid protease, partial [Hypoxylon sp. FL1857]
LDLRPRDGPPNSARLRWLDDVYEYTTQIKIGTPGQVMTVRIELENFFTFNTIIPSTNATGCINTADISGSCRFGSFNQLLSSTFVVDDVRMNDDGAYAEVKFTDSIEFGGLSLPNYSMSLAYDTRPESIEMYIGVNLRIDNTEPSLPVLYLLGDDYQLPDNPIYGLTRSGQIATSAFSLWFDEDDYSGELLLGAIDAQRYEGDLVSLDTYHSGGYPMRSGDPSSTGVIAIAMTSLSASSSTGTDDIWVQGPLLVRVKLGDDLWLSPYIAAQIRNITGAFVRLDETGKYEYTVIPCSMRNSEGYFTFGFGGPESLKVNVTMRSLVTPPSRKLRELFNSFGDDMCRFGISEVKGYDVGFLSSHLLRSVYTVVDLYNNKVAMAPVRRNVEVGGSNIVTFDGHAAPIPSATMAPNQPSMVSTIAWSGPPQPPSFRAAEGFGILTTTRSSLHSLPTSLLQPAPDVPDAASGEGLNQMTEVGIGLGISLVVLPLIIGALLVWRRRKIHRIITGLLAQQPLHNEMPELEGASTEVVQIKPPYEIHGRPQPAELPGVREPSELCGLESYKELPGPPVPEKGRNMSKGERA